MEVCVYLARMLKSVTLPRKGPECSKVWHYLEKRESCKSVGIGECSFPHTRSSHPIMEDEQKLPLCLHNPKQPPQIGPSRKGKHHIYQMAISRVKRTSATTLYYTLYTTLFQVAKATKTGQTLNITAVIAKRDWVNSIARGTTDPGYRLYNLNNFSWQKSI